MKTVVVIDVEMKLLLVSEAYQYTARKVAGSAYEFTHYKRPQPSQTERELFVAT